MPRRALAHLRQDHHIRLPGSDPRPGVRLKSRRVAIAEGTLAVDDSGPRAGSGADPGGSVLLLHGFSFDRSSWDPQVASLAEHYRTVRYDLRGFGESEPPVAGRSHLDDLIELLDLLKIDRAILVGLSLGANVALAALVEHPARVARAVLASPGLPGYRWKTPRPPDEAADYARVHGVDAGRRFWLDHRLFTPTNDYPGARAHLERMVNGFAGVQWTAAAQADPLPPVSDRLAEVRAPTLVLYGARDVAGYREIARLLAARIPGALLQELPDAGHLINLEQPTLFTRCVLDFLADP